MTRHQILAAALSAAAIIASPAWACSLAPMPPPLPGESPDAYKARVAEENRKQAERWIRERQASALQRADLIFIARDTVAPYSISTTRRPVARPVKRMKGSPVRRTGLGQPPPVPLPVRPVLVEYPAPSWYKPVDWFKGTRPTASFRVERSNTTCGAMSIGDTSFSTPGDLYVFFARKGPLSEKTLIDAIAIDKVNDPALTAFAARHRGKPHGARP